MNRPLPRGVWLLALLSLTVGTASASSHEPVRIYRNAQPFFPGSLLRTAVREGVARVAFLVDYDGKLREWLIVAYTEPQFAQEVVRVLKRWEFDPATVDGQPVSAVMEVTVRFERQGTIIVSQDMTEHLEARAPRPEGLMYRYWARSLRELDHGLKARHMPAPEVPLWILQRNARDQVTVEFYVDEEGRVRLPAIVKSTRPDLQVPVMEALEKWSFEPATVRGERVLVRARQTFTFKPPAEPPST